MNTALPQKEKVFSPYQAFIIAILVFMQFTVILDFMVLSPLGVILMPKMNMSSSQFGVVVSAYAFSSCIASIAAAGIADRFDRKRFLLVVYTGFLLGTMFCALATDYHTLMGARIFTGIFGGLVTACSGAIVTDLFKLEVRGRVMGTLMMSFAGAQVLGLPIGLFLAKHFSWHMPFLMIVGIGFVVGIIILIKMQPITGHLEHKSDKNPFHHLWLTVSNPEYLRAFAASMLLATGGFMLMPFGSTFSVNNMHRTLDEIPYIYLATGISSMILGPLIGKMADKVGKFNVFAFGSIMTAIMVAVYTNLGPTPLYLAIVLNILLFVGITARMISSSALISAIPKPQDRGAFMSINSAMSNLAGGIGAIIAGYIVHQQTPTSPLEHYDILGYVVIVVVAIVATLMYVLNRHIHNKLAVPVNKPI
jgi:predicted MFS family arabinose efflux permease